MLEKMDAFFEKRLDGYDEHMRTNVDDEGQFYAFTAAQLPKAAGAKILDLGCGTGLELEEYFPLNPTAEITGIDLCRPMLEALEKKFPGKKLRLICASYFDEPIEKEYFDAAVSVESLHHFTKQQKIPLYKKLCNGLKKGGYFILTDYFADHQEREDYFQRELIRLKKEQGIEDNAFYHYDTPLTVANETDALLQGGFSGVEILNQWGSTYTLKAIK
ncbi:MAG: class I SAM-dependent methyltransferase [Clostridia bacterium]|nr:class I SAM-dependent methyltransferase [Clostridia bacterium]